MMLSILFTLTACGTTSNNAGTTGENAKNIEVVVYDSTGTKIYDNAAVTDSDKLLDALKGIQNLTIVTEDSQYGAFITSINGIAQDDSHFWNYYVNGEYANVGVSTYEIQNNDKFEFRLEKFNE